MRLFLIAAALTQALAIQPDQIRLEYCVPERCVVDSRLPRVSWALAGTDKSDHGVVQTSYEIAVATSSGNQIWSSGKTTSNRTVNMETTTVESDSDYTVTVTVWDDMGRSGSASQAFSTALLDASDWGSSAWLTTQDNNRLLRAEFSLSAAPTRAVMYVATGNYWKAWVNGERANTNELGTFTTFEERVLYAAEDVSEHLRAGNNVLALSVGNGWYSQSSVNVGPPTVRVMLSVTDAQGRKQLLAPLGGNNAGSTVALNFTAGPSPVVSDDIYIGEAYDATIEQPGWTQTGFAPSSPWPSATVTDGGAAGKAALSLWRVPIVTDATFTAVSVSEPQPGVFVADMGQNMAGFCTIRIPQGASAGTTIVMQHAEMLHPDGTINDVFHNSPMWSNYTVRGDGAATSYTPQFTYFGFRYVQITGWPGAPTPDDFEAHFVHSANARTGAFDSNNQLLNSVVDITRKAAESNQMNVPTDCPQRERRGWMGDAQLSCETVLVAQDAGAFYSKFVRDIGDSQRFIDQKGAVPDCVPWYHHGGAPADPAWGTAAALIPRWAAAYLDDDRMINDTYATTKAFVDSELARSSAGILSASRYGDWCGVYQDIGERCPHPSPVVSTYYLIQDLDTVAEFATRLGKQDDATHYSQLATQSRQALVDTFYHENNNSFYRGFQMDLLVPLATDNLPLTAAQQQGLFDSLVQRLTTSSAFPMHPSGGIVYTKLLWQVLEAYGRSDLGVSVLLAGPDKPSFGEMINQTATTLWESWNMDEFDGTASRNHIMFGGASGLWPYTSIAGFKRQGRGWNQMRIAPQVAAAAPHVSAVSSSIASPVGLYESSWTTDVSSQGTCQQNVPEHSTATFVCLGPDGKQSPSYTFTGVEFASFGTSTGSCSSGFNLSSCNANTSVSVLKAACVNKTSCSVMVSDDVFGDPCYETVKHFNARLSGPCASTLLTMEAAFPANTAGDVVVPVKDPSSATVRTSSGQTVWSSGSYTPGAPGVTGAQAVAGGIAISVGSGSYSFSVTANGL